MQEELTEKQIREYIDKYITILDNNFRTNYCKKLTNDELFSIYTNLYVLFNEYYVQNQIEASKLAVKNYIPLMDLIVKLDVTINNREEYLKQVKNAYRIGARTNLECYFIYREWDERPEDKFFEPRYEAIRGYIYYLQEIVTNPNFRLIVFNAMSGFGKTYPEKISEAWAFGVDPTKTVLSLCSNDDVVKGGSRTVIDEIKSEPFGEVFLDMKWNEEDKNFFLKETDSMWKLRNCKLGASYYAKTVQSNVVGVRASQRIHIDDLYADYKEAMSQSLNEYYLNKYLTVWSKRFVQNEIPKVVVTGTLWASGDFINLLIELMKKRYKFHRHKKFKFTYINEEETVAIIQIPALDYETGLSTCPELKTTKELLEEKANIDEYLWETNFQQKPTDPDSLFFSWNKLRTYEKLPITEYTSGYAAIDATRKSGKDFFAMPIFIKGETEEGYDYFLKDCLYTRTATKDMYEDICNKIIEHHIVVLVIESNVTSELKQNIDIILEQHGVFFCQIIEKYNSENKAMRIEAEKGIVLKQMVFPAKHLFGVNSDMGKFMSNITLYNANGRNETDDAIDSVCMVASEIIEGNSKPTKIKIIKRPF